MSSPPPSRRPNPRLWVTRAQPQAEATARRLAALGWTPVIAPVLVLTPLAAAPDLAGVEALAFTSQAAVQAFAATTPERGLPVFAVGEATAAAGRRAGFAQVTVPAPAAGAEALAALIAQARPALVLNPTARHPAVDLAVLLAARGVSARSLAVYDNGASDLAAAPADLGGVLVHSPLAARRVATLLTPESAANLGLWAISPAAAAPLAGLGFARIVVADQPDEAALLAALGEAP